MIGPVAGGSKPQLIPVPIVAPGSLGLNLQQQNQVLPPQWAIEAQNAVIDYGGRVSARGGLTSATSAAGTGVVRTLFEHRTPTGTSTTIIASDGSISGNTATPGDNSLGGTLTWPTGGRWYFVNFNSKAIGFQSGQTPIVRTTSNFAKITASTGTVPVGTGVGTAAFGRLWVVGADGQTIYYCALLDETNWGAGDSGSINMSKVWPQGTDQITAIVAFNGTLAVFGTRQIVFYGSTNPTVLGLDVTQIQVVDVIEGTGTISQWTVAPVGETDIIFCSLIGIQSLQRLLVNRSRPTTQLSKYVRDNLIGMLATENPQNITGIYSPTNGFYALSLPVSTYTWIADQRHRYTDADGDEVSRMTRWTIAPTAMIELFNRTVYVSDVTGVIGLYEPGTDYGNNFDFVLQLPWMDLGQEVAAHLKALKKISLTLYLREPTTATITWYTDFSASGDTSTITLTGVLSSEWGLGQWGLSQWSAGLDLTQATVPGSRTGQYFSLVIESVTDSWFTVQQVNLLAKLLRLAP